MATAILAVTVMTSMIAGQVFALLASPPPSETFTGGAGGIGGAGGAGGVAGNGGVNSFSGSQIGSDNDNDQDANGGSANRGHGGSANGGNVCEKAKCTS